MQFKVDSNHLAKWIGSMRIQSKLIQCAFSVDATNAHGMHIEYAFDVQCGQAFNPLLDAVYNTMNIFNEHMYVICVYVYYASLVMCN